MNFFEKIAMVLLGKAVLNTLCDITKPTDVKQNTKSNWELQFEKKRAEMSSDEWEEIEKNVNKQMLNVDPNDIGYRIDKMYAFKEEIQQHDFEKWREKVNVENAVYEKMINEKYKK